MTGIIGTIGMIITRLSTLVALCNNVIRNPFPNLWSNTKFLPMNLLSIPSSLIWRVYSMIPPSSWNTFLNP